MGFCDVSRVVPVLLGLSAVLCPLRAMGQTEAPLELKWSAPESCPGPKTVLDRVHQIAGSSKPAGGPLRAEATITELADHRFHLLLAIQYGELAAERNIDGKSCKDLAGAAALALALLLSSGEPLSAQDLAGPASADPAVPKNPQAPPSPPPEPPAAPSPEEPRERRRHTLLVAPLGALSIGPRQRTSRGLGLAAGQSFDSWWFLVGGELWASQRATITNLGDAYAVDLHRFTVNVRGCRSLWKARFQIAPCVLMSVQHLSARGSGPNLVPQTDTATWLSAGVGVEARVLLTPWLGLVAGIDGEVQFSRPEIALQGVGFVERFGPAAATITVGSEWIF